MSGLTILLPPSETKREGGDDTRPFDLGALSFPELTSERVAVIAAARSVSSDDESARYALRLGPRSVGERLRNLSLEGAPTLPAVERYTGVLYDPLDASSAPPAVREWWHRHVIVQSAMFGPIAAGDPIPAYRLSHDARLGNLRLGSVWPGSTARALGSRGVDGVVLDLRSEGYRALGPVSGSVRLRVVSEGTDGRRRALNHWNKTAKGRLVSALGRAQIEPGSMSDLADWARTVGIGLDRTSDGWDLVAETLEPATV
ncbi:peroxide stress protein YaaA [Curtobacterium sp. MCBD17_040]|uniref:YaaA family protein n=1 Tax=Curtobacterium sp. MCBD17_040 TaxID=2175674 RepID=UPI000DA87A2D|nr:peroxide stress protein YaaA [Curtobacterium sp. MCBD17_040]WIB65157.1 peroxide stress protein YaaA [Curtobacterium sp. MCBD17_040]